MVLWIGSLVILTVIDIADLSPFWILPAILGRTFAQTGLFIIAHDAIHGAVYPSDRRINHGIGRLAVTLYALLSYQKLTLNHLQHHLYPGQPGDPDFYHGTDNNFFVWYLKFMRGYLDARQQIVLLLGLGIIFFTLHWGLQISITNLLLFWVLPIGFSSMQLFLFGTYLPHRSPKVESTHRLNFVFEGSNPAANIHHATSSHYPFLVSFLTCYHFGYHWEHHEYPFLPWYRLPSIYHNNQQDPPEQCKSF